MSTSNNWISVCSDTDLVANSGVCALLNEQQIALFKIKNANDEQVFAVSNWDPIGKANVLYRGLLGSVENAKVIISPLYKQRYCLSSGQCLDDDAIKLTVYPVRIENNQVQLQLAD
ncbi:nitrite reductase small subunit NirD [Paraglaciecola psychrophila]|jgi:nitrite reductase (NADH) small subunit|uniref:Nitrite reductase (NAD(P)H) small subunit n=1 Tax=Paraglaciecola psychrophila 170 TaxID=1129794 RepID=K6ZPA7_9ALTE|nr:nitrite reductase small subunit NirD [Paraglaciecola psychrophila]AGH44739.1 nitrite reductase (NAD(P)H) small subunit [Paraglaciecola psychrophila 170]GAC37776.1 nitrite reductase (NAD(P)H) small subunit [Paraglaciecola psychrophila 170]